MGLSDLFGTTLLSKEGNIETSSVKAKAVFIYFSAHWCPPCRGFTPVLAKWYKALKEKGMDIEVVFVSSDKDESSFNDYYNEMPWLALPFSERELKASLSSKFKISGIPSLLVADGGTGEVYSKDGRSIVAGDEQMTGEGFPWVPPTLEELLSGPFTRSDGSEVPGSELKGRKIAIYASAAWCGPCQAFTPKLMDVYKKTIDEGKDWEVIFLSGDRDEKSMKEYFQKQPWLAIPFGDKKTRSGLMSHFEIEGYPTMIMLDEDRTVLNKSLRGYIMEDPEGKDFPWIPKPVLSLDQAEGINESPTLIIMMEKEGDVTRAQFGEIINKLASAHKEKVKAKEAEEMFFCIAETEGGLAARVRQLTKIPDTKRALCNGDFCMKLDDSSAVLLLDIPDNGGYYLLDGELSSESISKFYSAYLDGSLKKDRQQLE